jgi:hypothetical protein
MDTPTSLPLLTRGNAQRVAVFEALEPRAMLYSDLQIESIELTPPGATYHPGENLDATVTVRALGHYGGFTANTTIAAILSQDTVWGNEDDLPAGEFILWDNLTSTFPDGRVPIMFDWLVLPDSLQNAANTGDYHLGVRLDIGGQLNETDESNNTGWSETTIHLDASTATLPDLRVDRVTIPNPPAAFRVGEHVSTRRECAARSRALARSDLGQ